MSIVFSTTKSMFSGENEHFSLSFGHSMGTASISTSSVSSDDDSTWIFHKKRETIQYSCLQGPPHAFQLLARGKHDRVVDDFSDKIDSRNFKILSDKSTGMAESNKGSCKRTYNTPQAKLPKKSPGLFGLFVQENYAKVEAGLIRGVNAREVMSALSGKWKSLSNEDKEKLKEKHDKLHKEYNEQVISFWQELNSEERAFLEEKHGPKMRQLAKERRHFLGYPKRPPSPFILFVQRSANGIESASVIERTKILGQKWREMSNDEKEVYFEENRQAQKQYKKDITKWKAKYPEVS